VGLNFTPWGGGGGGGDFCPIFKNSVWLSDLNYCMLIKEVQARFFFSFVSRWSGDHLQEDLAKFGY
jgi:hypothetical protein